MVLHIHRTSSIAIMISWIEHVHGNTFDSLDSPFNIVYCCMQNASLTFVCISEIESIAAFGISRSRDSILNININMKWKLYLIKCEIQWNHFNYEQKCHNRIKKITRCHRMTRLWITSINFCSTLCKFSAIFPLLRFCSMSMKICLSCTLHWCRCIHGLACSLLNAINYQ